MYPPVSMRGPEYAAESDLVEVHCSVQQSGVVIYKTQLQLPPTATMLDDTLALVIMESALMVSVRLLWDRKQPPSPPWDELQPAARVCPLFGVVPLAMQVACHVDDEGDHEARSGVVHSGDACPVLPRLQTSLDQGKITVVVGENNE
jgi:hypothetical protein